MKTLPLSCNIIGGATGAYAWGYDSGASPSATGLTSSQSATITENDSNGQKMTLSSGGTLTVQEDLASSLTYRLVSANTTGNILGRLKFHASQEAITLDKVAFQLSPVTERTPTNGTDVASSSPRDLVGNLVTLFTDSGTPVGTAVFSGTNRNATSTLTSTFTIPKDGDAYLVIKGDIADIGVSGNATQGHLVKIDYDGDDSTGTRGTGASSGTQINQSSGSDTAMTGVRIFKSVPLVQDVTGTPAANALVPGNDLYKFTVTANPTGTQGVNLYKVTFSVATSVATVTGFQLFGPNGAVNATALNLVQTAGGTDKRIDIIFDATAPDRYVAPGSPKTYAVRASSVTHGGANTTDTLTLQLLGDNAYPSRYAGVFASSTEHAFMHEATSINDSLTPTASNNFIWSPQATTTVVAADNDFTNSYGVPTGSGNNTLINNLTSRSFNYSN